MDNMNPPRTSCKPQISSRLIFLRRTRAQAHTHTRARASKLQLPSDSCFAKVIDFIILGFITVMSSDKELCIFVSTKECKVGLWTLWPSLFSKLGQR